MVRFPTFKTKILNQYFQERLLYLSLGFYARETKIREEIHQGYSFHPELT